MVSDKKTFDFIVIGVGSMGSAACFNLARRGFSVLGLERFKTPHEHGAHSGHTRLIRKAYFEHEDYVPLLTRSYELWDELESISGRKIFSRTGLLYAGPEGDELLAGVRHSAERYGIELSAIGNLSAFPQFELPEDFEVLFEPDAGFLSTDAAILSFVEEARRSGAVISEGEQVLGWDQVDDGVRVDTERGSYHAAKVVITAGPWAARFVPGIRGNLSVTRQVLAWFGANDPRVFEAGAFPCWAIVDRGSPGLFYGFPWNPTSSYGEPVGLKIAHHHQGEPTEPDGVSRDISDADTEPLSSFVSRYLPGASVSVGTAKTCLYSNSPDGHFVIDNLPGLEKYACVAWGFSGHGFKFTSVVGEILADLAVDGRTGQPTGFLGASRFA